MGDLPRPARLYIGLLIFLAAGLTAISLAISPLRLESPPIAAALLIAACVAQLFKVRSLNHQSYYTTTIFFVAGALLLDPALVVLIVVVAHLVELFRERYRWYIQAFNIANFSLCALVAGFIVRAGPVVPPAGFEVARGVAAGIAFVVLNHLLTALVIMCARRLSLAARAHPAGGGAHRSQDQPLQPEALDPGRLGGGGAGGEVPPADQRGPGRRRSGARPEQPPRTHRGGPNDPASGRRHPASAESV